MEHSPKEIENLRSLFKKYKYYPVDSAFTRENLTELNLYRKLTVKGKTSYILFHKKGSPITGDIPSCLYIAEDDMETYLDLAGSGKERDETAERQNSILDGNFDRDILDNPEISAQRKIELTLECAGEVMAGIFELSELGPEHIENIRKVGKNLNNFIQTVITEENEESFLLDRLIGHDYYTYSHSIHVALYSGLLASEMARQGVSTFRGSVRYLCLGALMHDIGKIKVDRGIINKKGRLTPPEFEQIKNHPSFGATIAKDAREHPDVIMLIREHHEQWGGGGYPTGLKGEQISESGRIACICDVFDALTTQRTYRPALLTFDALSLMLRSMRNNFYLPYLQFFIKFLGNLTR